MTRKFPTIERGIPIPAKASGASQWKPLLNSMQVGDSFVTGKRKMNHVYRVAATISPKPKFTTRSINTTEVRVWRIAK